MSSVESSESGPKRTLSVTLLGWGVLIQAVFSLVRGVSLLARRDFLAQFGPEVPWLYLAAGGLAWGVILLAVTWGLWRLDRWGYGLAWGALPVYAAHRWLDRGLLAVSDYAGQSWPWYLLLTVIGLAVSGYILWHPDNRRLFGR